MREDAARPERVVDHSWVHADLRRLHSPDVDDLRSYAPDGPFCVFVQAMIGPKGEVGEESFDFEVCSPSWLAAELERHEIISGRTLLFMAEFNYDAIERYVLKCLAHATGRNWNEVAQKLARWSAWEFDDYVDYKSK